MAERVSRNLRAIDALGAGGGMGSDVFCNFCNKPLRLGEAPIVIGIAVTNPGSPGPLSTEVQFAHKECASRKHSNHVRDAVRANQ